jgi:hypothetical protein
MDTDLGEFGPPLAPNPTFGFASSILGNVAGFANLYNVGGPRSLQISLRLHF